MGRIIADALYGDLDVVLVHKLGAPGNPELAIGAVNEDGHVFIGENARRIGVRPSYVEREAERQRQMLTNRRETYTPDRERIDPTGRTVIVVDDGVEGHHDGGPRRRAPGRPSAPDRYGGRGTPEHAQPASGRGG
jgi:predicted phosphoribosyltransferase